MEKEQYQNRVCYNQLYLAYWKCKDLCNVNEASKGIFLSLPTKGHTLDLYKQYLLENHFNLLIDQYWKRPFRDCSVKLRKSMSSLHTERISLVNNLNYTLVLRKHLRKSQLKKKQHTHTFRGTQKRQSDQLEQRLKSIILNCVFAPHITSNRINKPLAYFQRICILWCNVHNIVVLNAPCKWCKNIHSSTPIWHMTILCLCIVCDFVAAQIVNSIKLIDFSGLSIRFGNAVHSFYHIRWTK